MRLSLLLPLLIAGCGPKAVCPGPVGWEPGRPIFQERTSEWGLEGVEGVRLVVADIDGDGWPDLSVHRGGDERDDRSEGGTRVAWLLRNTGAGRFEDVSASSGFRAMREDQADHLGRAGSIVAFGDVDGDGDLDAFTGVGDPDGNRVDTSDILLNRGDGTFFLAPPSEVQVERGEVPAGASFLDYDHDGRLDLFVPQHREQDRLYKGYGDGTFFEVARDVGLRTRPWQSLDELDAGLGHSVAWSSLACDLNDDGWSELLVGSYGRAPNMLFQGGPEGFVNQSVESGFAFDERTDWTDNQFARCYCKLNRSAEGCAAVPEPAVTCNSSSDVLVWTHNNDRRPYRLGGNNATILCRDVDNDGDVDLLTTSIKHWWAGSSSDPSELLFQDGNTLSFERPGNEVTGLTREHTGTTWDDGDMTAALFDFDNDGWTDVYIGSSDYTGARGLLFRQVEAGRFEPVDLADGIDHTRSHGVAVADFDRDGDLDVVVGHSRARCGGTADCYETSQIRFFENQLGGNFVQIDLEGVGSGNPMAVGARVRLTAGGLTQRQELTAGHGHYGAQDPATLHFGLADQCEAEVEVRWPDSEGTVETFEVKAGWRWKLTQGGGATVVE
jgi:hypothetical protein